jgi:uncharacterized tellurite resistance protein B-like protein
MALNPSNIVENSEVFTLSDVDSSHDFASVKLTPPLALTIAIMFIIASDGHLDEAESSQIQSVIGQNEELLRFASQYVRVVPLKVFLARVAQGLSGRDKICILSNVCDAILSDGHVHAGEEKTFQLLLAAFGVSKKEFLSHTITLQLKNDLSVLGDYKLAQVSSSMTPHLALAASVLYMMTADGTIDKNEIGRLETLVAKFDGLQKIAVDYVKENKRERFIQEAAYVLSAEQKLCILLNVYDTITSDGVVAVTEDKIFDAISAAFGVTASALAAHLKVLEDKNLKPFDVSKVNLDHFFEMMQAHEERQSLQLGEARPETMGEMVSRTMQDNIAKVEQEIGGGANLVQIQGNAIDAQNLQKIDAANDPRHLEKIATSAGSTNRALLESGRTEGNRALLDVNSPLVNRQSLNGDALSTHHEALSLQGLADGSVVVEKTGFVKNDHALSAEIRIDHLSEDIQSLHEQLTLFENKNRSWLNIGKLFQQSEEKNPQKIFEEESLPNTFAIAKAQFGKNLQTLEADEQGINRQKIISNDGLKVNTCHLGNGSIREKVSSTGADEVSQMSLPSNPQVHAYIEDKESSCKRSPNKVNELLVVAKADSKRGHDYIPFKGRVLDWRKSLKPLGLKEFALALSLMFCVSNLGASKSPIKANEARGVLLRLSIDIN